MPHNIEHGPVEVPNNTGPYGNPTDLLHSKSSLSLVGNTTAIEEMDIQDGTPAYNRGLTTGAPNPSPFDVSGNTAEEGHLVDLLNKDVESTRLNASSPAQSDKWMGNSPLLDLDLEGQQPGFFTTGLGQNDGKKLNGKDLHVEMMQSTYSYSHGAAGPWQTGALVGNTPSLSPYQDLTDEYVTGPLGSPSDLEPAWNYNSTGPSSPFNN